MLYQLKDFLPLFPYSGKYGKKQNPLHGKEQVT
jgi:hypothetical protein